MIREIKPISGQVLWHYTIEKMDMICYYIHFFMFSFTLSTGRFLIKNILFLDNYQEVGDQKPFCVIGRYELTTYVL